MKRHYQKIMVGLIIIMTFNLFCKKDDFVSPTPAIDFYNLDVNLNGTGKMTGTIAFRQDADTARIITLETKVQQLLPNHEYLLQRAVDPINVVDGNCTSTTWLTLGKGLTPRSIITDPYGNGSEILWRDITSVPRESEFDIHFQVVDAVDMSVVLTSNCYKYKVR